MLVSRRRKRVPLSILQALTFRVNKVNSKPAHHKYLPVLGESYPILYRSSIWKPLSHTISEYIDHPEYKFEDDIGHLERKHVIGEDIVYIGKEANAIENQLLEVRSAQQFLNQKQIMQNIFKLRQKDAEACGVDRMTFQGIKRRIKEKRDLNLNTPAVKRLLIPMLAMNYI